MLKVETCLSAVFLLLLVTGFAVASCVTVPVGAASVSEAAL